MRPWYDDGVATLADIRERTGYSLATISRVANGQGGVRPDVRSAIEAAIHELGYATRAPRGVGAVEVVLHRCEPVERIDAASGAVAVGPRVEATAETLLTAPWKLGNAFYRRILAGIQEEIARSHGTASLVVVNDLAPLVSARSPRRKPARAAEARRGARGREDRPAAPRPPGQGLLVVGEGGAGLAELIAASTGPVVLVDILHDGPADQVTSDNLGGIGLAVRHLVEHGHRRLGYVTGSGAATTRERAEAFAFHAFRHGVAVAAPWDAIAYTSIADTGERLAALLARPDRPTSLVCCNDYAALAALRAAQRIGLVVPRDLSVIGFDDVDVAALVTPALTTVHVAAEDIGRQAVRQLATRREPPDPLRPGCVVRLPTRLTLRDSVAAPPR